MSGDRTEDRTEDRHSTRRRRESVVWIVLVALAAGFLVWRVVDNPTPTLHPVNDTVDAGPATVGHAYVDNNVVGAASRDATVRLPIGTAYVSTAMPTTGVVTPDDDDVTPPAGGSFVSVDLTLDSSTSTVPIDDIGSNGYRVRTTVIAGGHRYPLPPKRDGELAPDVVAVAGHPTAPSVEITYAGVSQRVDMATGKVSPGTVAAPLYRTAPSGTQSCGQASLSSPYEQTHATYPLTCTVSWRQVPFAPGRGWAKGGSAWVLVSVTTNGPGAVLHRGKLEDVYSGDGSLTVTCGDGSAASDLDREPSYRNRDAVSLVVCPASSHAISIAERLEALADEPFQARWSLRLA